MQWREGIDLGQFQNCWECGLSQSICRRFASGSTTSQRISSQDDDSYCEYMEVMLPSIFIVMQQGHLQRAVEGIGFRGVYPEDVWEWMLEVEERVGLVRESNWMATWREICWWLIKHI